MAPQKLILFDLDDTLSDCKSPIRTALLAVQASDPAFANLDLEELVEQFKNADIRTWNKHGQRTLDIIDKDSHSQESVSAHQEFEKSKLKRFYKYLDLPYPDHTVREAFTRTYKAAFSTGYKATPGTVKVLTRLRALGYRIAVITDGRAGVSKKKLKAIGAEEFVERLFTPADVNGHRKPDTEIFELAVREMGGSKELTWVVGDGVTRDVKGAIDAGLKPIVYFPEEHDDGGGISVGSWYGKRVPIITRMDQLLEVLQRGGAADGA